MKNIEKSLKNTITLKNTENMKTTEKAIINNEKQWNTQWKIMKTNGKWWKFIKNKKKKETNNEQKQKHRKTQ